jgi:uncharacterized GH25 family protein
MMKTFSFRLPFFSLMLFGLLAFAPAQVLNTSLRLTVLNELGNPVEGASVTLYNSQEDYRNEQNPVGETQTSDKKGRVRFGKLEPKVYFIHATKDDMSNAGAGSQTENLQSGRINKSTVIID